MYVKTINIFCRKVVLSNCKHLYVKYVIRIKTGYCMKIIHIGSNFLPLYQKKRNQKNPDGKTGHKISLK